MATRGGGSEQQHRCRIVEIINETRDISNYAVKVALQAKNDLGNAYHAIDRHDRELHETIRDLEITLAEYKSTINYVKESLSQYGSRVDKLEQKKEKLYLQLDTHCCCQYGEDEADGEDV